MLITEQMDLNALRDLIADGHCNISTPDLRRIRAALCKRWPDHNTVEIDSLQFMATVEAAILPQVGDLVISTIDGDEGRLVEMGEGSRTALVAWSGGVRTWAQICDLERA